jgi:hypothetical protein
VAVLAFPKMSGRRLQELAWQLEGTGTELCAASAVIDVAGPEDHVGSDQGHWCLLETG